MLTVADWLAIGLAAACSVSVALNPPSDPKQLILLLLTLFAYPAARGLSGLMTERIFVVMIGTLVWGGIALIVYLMAGDIPVGKPEIFGYNHGSVQLAVLLAPLSFALICSSMRLAFVAIITAFPFAILAAAQVRFTLIAIIACLAIGAVLSRHPLRMRFAILAAVAFIAVAAGAVIRKTSTLEYLRYAEESLNIKAAPHVVGPTQIPGEAALRIPAQDCPEVNLNNSIDMRKRLYADAFSLLPTAGLTGIGLGRFQGISCVHAEVHNSILQTAVELGWPAGILFVALILMVARSLIFRRDTDALFALLSLTFAVMISFVSGRITEDIFLFLMIGYGASTASEKRP